MSKSNQDSFESKLKRLEEIIEALDQGDQPIDKMLDLYEEGSKLSAELKTYLNQAEQRLINVNQAKIIEE